MKLFSLFCILTALALISMKILMPTGTLAAEDLQVAGDGGPVVLELFTSQSCSSCPAADRLLQQVADTPGVIALGFHVTYWDHLGWKDTLSQGFATERQKSYAAVRATSRVYTPQMVVNGRDEFVGSDAGKIKAALHAVSPLQTIGLSQMENGQIVMNLKEIPGNGSYTLWLFGVKDSLTQPIESGENRGRTVTYSHAVVTEGNLGGWDGRKAQKVYDLPSAQDIDRIVVLAQNGKTGPIKEAGMLHISGN